MLDSGEWGSVPLDPGKWDKPIRKRRGRGMHNRASGVLDRINGIRLSRGF